MKLWFRSTIRRSGVICVLIAASFSGVAIGQVCYSDAVSTAPTAAFTNNSDGTVTDNRTGLVWAICSEGQAWFSGGCTGSAGVFDWDAALGVSVTKNAESYLGYTDWRLPNKAELASILELSCVNPAINTVVFPNSPNTIYWSSTPALHANANGSSWRVVFNYGNITLAARDSSYAVRLVRN